MTRPVIKAAIIRLAPTNELSAITIVQLHAQRIKSSRFDLDRDGRLDRAERAAFRRKLEELRRPRRHLW